MKIAIDISMAFGQSAGVGTYTRGLIEGLTTVDAENEYLLYSYLEMPESSLLDFPQQPNISWRPVEVTGSSGGMKQNCRPTRHWVMWTSFIARSSTRRGGIREDSWSRFTTFPSCYTRNFTPKGIGCTASMAR